MGLGLGGCGAYIARIPGRSSYMYVLVIVRVRVLVRIDGFDYVHVLIRKVYYYYYTCTYM